MTSPVNPTPQTDKKTNRPPGRPRNLLIRESILKAARELMEELGFAGISMEAIAKRASVGKPTVYRWWPNRHAVVMAALMDKPLLHVEQQKNCSALNALEQQLCLVAETLTSRHGRHLTAIIATADPDTEIAKAFRHHFVLTRRNEGQVIIEQGLKNGEILKNLDIDIVLDQLYGALFFRVLLGHASVDVSFVSKLMKQVFSGLTK